MRCLVGFAAGMLFAQDPFTVSPRNYKLEFENKLVRVTRVSYQPGDKLPVHDHPPLPTIYIYVTDGGPILFGHQEFAAIRRPAVKAGQIRFNRGNKETHTTEYLGDAPSEYVRVELRMEPLEKPRRDVRIPAEDNTPFENAQLRIERADCAPCGALADPGVVVTMADGRVRWVHGEAAPSGRQIRVVLKGAAQAPVIRSE
jgi:hypothetical protein